MTCTSWSDKSDNGDVFELPQVFNELRKERRMISMHNMARPVATAALVAVVTFIGCKKSDEATGPSAAGTYQQIVADGWTLFTQKQYLQARDKFAEAKANDATRAEAYAGSGWSLFKLFDLTQADTEFSAGSSKSNPPANLFAGWAFLLNAQKDYAGSNGKIELTLSKDSTWSFSYGITLRVKDLRILKAENFFMLGNFAQSLSEVRKVNAAFNADVTLTTGVAQLAQEIERLKSVP
jgi:hypothetical protein